MQCASAAAGAREPLREIFVHSGSIGDIIPDLDELAGKVSRFARGETVVSRQSRGGARRRDLRAGLCRRCLTRVKSLETERGRPRGQEEDEAGLGPRGFALCAPLC